MFMIIWQQLPNQVGRVGRTGGTGLEAVSNPHTSSQNLCFLFSQLVTSHITPILASQEPKCDYQIRNVPGKIQNQYQKLPDIPLCAERCQILSSLNNFLTSKAEY